MRFSITFLFFFTALFVLHSCKPMPNDGIPFYLKIDSVEVAGNQTHHITDVWVEANAQELGTYELPCNFPVLQEDEVRLVLNAGVEESGQSAVRVIYPFYLPDTFTITAVRAERYTRLPVFKYKAGAQFAFTEDFEFSSSYSSNMALATDSNVQYGLRCGVISTAIDSSMEAAQINKYDLPEGQEIWLEVDYKCEVPFYIGYYGTYSSGSVIRIPVLFVSAHASWNKLYVKLSNLIGQTQAATYNIYFEGLRPYGSGGGNVYIDNVKMVHF